MPIVRQNTTVEIHILDDENRSADGEWYSEIYGHLHKANIIVALISHHYLASQWCSENEAPIALKRAEEENVHVIPVLLRRCDWQFNSFSKFQALPRNGKPISEWSKRESAYHQVAVAIRAAVDYLARSQVRPVHFEDVPDIVEPKIEYAGKIVGKPQENRVMAEIDVFISHSSRDEEMARRLITLIRAALILPSDRIRCTSVDGFRLPAGISINEMLRQEIYDSKAFIVIITPTIDLQKKFRVPLRGQRTERLTVARHQSHDLVGHLSKVQQCFVHLCL